MILYFWRACPFGLQSHARPPSAHDCQDRIILDLGDVVVFALRWSGALSYEAPRLLEFGRFLAGAISAVWILWKKMRDRKFKSFPNPGCIRIPGLVSLENFGCQGFESESRMCPNHGCSSSDGDRIGYTTEVQVHLLSLP